MTISYGLNIHVLSVRENSTLTVGNQMMCDYTVVGSLTSRSAPHPFVIRIAVSDDELSSDCDPIGTWEGHPVSIYIYPQTGKVTGRIIKPSSEE